MEKEFVLYEEALALKELGFNEKCFGKYYYVREHEVYDPRKGEDFMFGDNNRIILRDNSCNYGYDANEITVCVAPIYQQAFRWFREKHDITYSIKWKMPKDGNGYRVKIYNGREVFNLSLYAIYEVAELACLKKLIELCQEN